ncbi:S8 family serine peptidase [Foetidibacter luteolus]|uniref:S8 family serine peptidase n=1 Tax=Foetidibacter luteolus TaxID=2608880 RepID=UPI001A992323|nr:S8 family serine peptidase [Foetidibacter luteolus]
MKKPLLFFLTAIVSCSIAAQDAPVHYYYKGQKQYVPVTFERILVGVEQRDAKNKLSLAREMGVNADSVIPAARPGQYIIRTGNAGSKVAITSKVEKMRRDKTISFMHPFLRSPSGKLVSYEDEFIVQLKRGKSASALNNLLAKYGCTLLRKYRFADGIYILSAGKANDYDALKMANLFFESGLFDYAEPNFTVHDAQADAPNDPLYNLQWPHKNTGAPEQYNGTPGADMQIDSAWLTTMGDADIKVAVIDTGVDTGHADLKPNLLQGYDCHTGTANPGDGAPKNLGNAHGTACAGIVAAVANNSIGVAGIAPNCKIIPINLSNENNIFASDEGKAGGFDYAWQNGADVITNSWYGGLPTGIIDGAIHRAVTEGRNGKGCVVLFASGNDNGGISYPSSNPEVISVGASSMCHQRKSPSSCDGEWLWGSNYGFGLDVTAPGVKIATTDISGANGYNQLPGSNGDYHPTFNGTSSACPNAAGVAALILSANKNLTAAEATLVLENSCIKPAAYDFAMKQGYPNGTWNNELGYGVVNAYRAVQAAQNGNFCNVIAKAQGKPVICKGTGVTLAVENPVSTASYQWRYNGGGAGTIASTYLASAAGTYDVVATYANGCIAYSEPVTITAATSPLQADAGKEVTFCPGGPGVRIGGSPAAAGGSAFPLGLRGYGLETFFNGGLMRFNIDNPAEYFFTDLPDNPGNNDKSFFAGDFTPLGYYLLTANGNLFRMDTATGQRSFIAYLQPEQAPNYGQSWAGLAWDAANKKLYAVTNGGYYNKLYTIDIISGAAYGGPLVPYNNIGWLACNKQGTLFAYLSDSRRIRRVNTTTGELYGAYSDDVGVNNLGRLDGAVDPLTGKLYLSTFYVLQKITNDLREVDTATGKITVTGTLGDISQVSSLAIADGAYQYTWSPKAGLSNPNDANPIAKPSATTVYKLTVTDFCGDTLIRTVKVNVSNTPPVAQISAPVDSICINETTRLSAATGNSYHYQWLNRGKEIQGATDSFYVAQRTGVYAVRVSAGLGGCQNTSAGFTVKDCSILLNNNNSDTVCTSYFYPSQGFVPDGFLPGESYVKTIYPAAPGNVLKLHFNSFNISSSHSILSVYDGENTDAPVIRHFSIGSLPQMPFDYFSSTGPLTFKFTSGAQVSGFGGNWDATITCYPRRVFRSKQNGNFGDASTWQVKTGEDTYQDAETFPTYIDDTIIIQSGHTVTLKTFAQVDQLWIQKNATLVAEGYMYLHNGEGHELTIDGTLQLMSTSLGGEYTTVVVNGNIISQGGSLTSALLITGTQPQSLVLPNTNVKSMNIMNNTSVTISGMANIDSLFLNTNGRLYLDTTCTVNLEMQLNRGIIEIKNNNALKMKYYRKLVGGGPESYVIGTLALTTDLPGLLNINFPIGTAQKYTPVTLTVSNMQLRYGDQYSARVFTTDPPVRTLPAGIEKLVNTRYYRFEALNKFPVHYYAVKLPYFEEDEVTDTASLRMLKDNTGTLWLNIGGAGSHVDTGTITSVEKFNYLGDFVLAKTAGTLPVNWVSFTAALQGKQVQLKWQVASEVNCDYYEVQHSSDGTHFTTLARVDAQTVIMPNKIYNWQHVNPAHGNNFYRIKQVDKDGRFSYSTTQLVHSLPVAQLQVSPNPSGGQTWVTAHELIKEINCYDMQGRLLSRTKPLAMQCQLLLQHLPAGVYNLRIETASGIHHIKLVKK